MKIKLRIKFHQSSFTSSDISLSIKNTQIKTTWDKNYYFLYKPAIENAVFKSHFC